MIYINPQGLARNYFWIASSNWVQIIILSKKINISCDKFDHMDDMFFVE